MSRQGLGLGSKRVWLALFAATASLSVSSRTEAAIYYWQDSPPAATEPAPTPKPPARRAKAQNPGQKKSAIAEKDAKPQGPLIISVSIAQQRLRLYDANGLFAESPISTGMPGHSTPMGVFSVIQKQKFHESNIYSGAPMPFMQRITWSGIALHAGVVPGHPASHGCIRLPMAFAVKMYSWTRMGARVIITPDEITPASFSHPLLASVKVVPQPVAAEETKTDAAAIHAQDKAEADATGSAIELRPTVGHSDDMKAANDAATKVKTADASGAVPASLSTSALSTNAIPDAALVNEQAPRQTKAAVSDKRETIGEAAATGSTPASEGPVEMPQAKLAEEETKPADAVSAQSTKAETTTVEAAKPDGKAPDADAVKATTTPPSPAAAANEMPPKGDFKSDFPKDSLTPPIKKTEQVAVFVSRKDSKLYVRQNFAPLFDVPVTITTDDRPLGTHIFTARVDRNDANVLHWSVVSLPAPVKAIIRHTEVSSSSHGRKIATAAIEAKSGPIPDGPAEALDRLNLPAEVMARIYEAASTGGSIIVSDQGIAGGETGEGTDFIVSLR